MAWVAVHQNGNEGIFDHKPTRGGLIGFWYDIQWIGVGCYDSEISLPKGSIRKLIGRDLNWNDEPVELKEE